MSIKEVKKSTKTSKNFYFTVFSHLQQGLNPAQICKELSISKQKLNYYLSSLKRSGFIEKIGYGVWTISKEFNEKEVKKTTRVAKRQLEEMKSDTVRGHAFQFILQLPKNLPNWDRREEIFDKMGFKYAPLILGGINRGQKIKFKGRKVWLTDGSIVLYEKSSFMADTAEEAKDYAISEIMGVMRALEKTLRADFSFAGKYKFRVSRQHYALVKNALAKQYDREGKKLEIYNHTGLWFLIDNSFNLHEAETVHSKTAVQDNTKVQNFFNGLKETENYTPAFVVTSLAKNSQNLDLLMREQVVYAQNIKSHIQAIQDLGYGVRELVGLVKEMKEAKK